MLVTLPSNGVQFPDNTNSTYSVRLDHQLKLESGKWEVGLMDIHFPNSWQNVDTGLIWNDITDANSGQTRRVAYRVRPGRYTKHADLIGEISRALSVSSHHAKLSVYFDSIRNKGFVNVNDRSMSVSFSRDLAEILGFTPSKTYGFGFHSSEQHPDINRGFSTLYVYCSLAAPRLVGDVQASLLRTVPIGKQDPYAAVYAEFQNVQYTPTGNIDTDIVQVLIRRDDGQPVAFGEGKVVLTVHFRKVE